jgi:hypothetical protein
LPAGPARLYTLTARAKSNHLILYPLMKKLQWRRGRIAGGSGYGLCYCVSDRRADFVDESPSDLRDCLRGRLPLSDFIAAKAGSGDKLRGDDGGGNHLEHDELRPGRLPSTSLRTPLSGVKQSTNKRGVSPALSRGHVDCFVATLLAMTDGDDPASIHHALDNHCLPRNAIEAIQNGEFGVRYLDLFHPSHGSHDEEARPDSRAGMRQDTPSLSPPPRRAGPSAPQPQCRRWRRFRPGRKYRRICRPRRARPGSGPGSARRPEPAPSVPGWRRQAR